MLLTLASILQRTLWSLEAFLNRLEFVFAKEGTAFVVFGQHHVGVHTSFLHTEMAEYSAMVEDFWQVG